MSRPFGSSGGGTPQGFQAAQGGMLPAGPSYSGNATAPASRADVGKVSVDLTDIMGSVIGGAQSIGGFLGGEVLPGFIPGGHDAIAGYGAGLGLLGGIELPRASVLGNRPGVIPLRGQRPAKNQQAAHLATSRAWSATRSWRSGPRRSAQGGRGRMTLEKAGMPASSGKSIDVVAAA
jgi:hypothetical protein